VEEVTLHASHEVLIEVDDKSVAFVNDPQGIFRSQQIHDVSIIEIIFNYYKIVMFY
jgi:hypothetical protein